MKSRAASVAAMAVFVILLDQLSKWAMLAWVGIDARPPIVVAPFFKLVMVWNQGVSFGMLNRGDHAYMPWFLIAVAVVISAILWRLAMRSAIGWERAGYAMVIGGALGNVIDRLRFGAVVDFLYFHLGDLGWPAFNVADAAICVGVGILLLMMMRHPDKP